jgi:hypothetical protein
MKLIKYGKRPCRMCGRMVTKNALGRAAHERACYGKLHAEACGAQPDHAENRLAGTEGRRAMKYVPYTDEGERVFHFSMSFATRAEAEYEAYPYDGHVVEFPDSETEFPKWVEVVR